MRLDEANFTVFDVETTGLFPYHGDRICEIAAMRADRDSERLKRFHALVDPCREISPGAFAVNGITGEMVRGKPRIDGVLPEFMKFIKGSVLVAYNAGFDLGFIECALNEKKDELNGFYVIDALSLARRLFTGLGRYNLGSVSRSLGIVTKVEHRAMQDAEMAWGVFKKALERLSEEGIINVDDVAYEKRGIDNAIRDQEKLNTNFTRDNTRE